MEVWISTQGGGRCFWNLHMNEMKFYILKDWESTLLKKNSTYLRNIFKEA